jgi:hypothetical protein
MTCSSACVLIKRPKELYSYRKHFKIYTFVNTAYLITVNHILRFTAVQLISLYFQASEGGSKGLKHVRPYI